MEIFVVIWFAFFFFILFKIISQFIENTNYPVLNGPSTIVAMRRKTHHHHSHSYHVTFEKENGERIELRVKRYEYKEFSIGDRGILTHQGTWYKGFER